MNCLNIFLADIRNDVIKIICLKTDSIEANVEQAYGNVEQGTQQLRKAADYQVGQRSPKGIL